MEEEKKEIVAESTDENIEVKDVIVKEAKPKKQRKPLTPEYKALLVERIANARNVKNKARKIGVTPKRVIVPDNKESKPYFCDVCKKSYASINSLKKHNVRFHSEKQLKNIIKEKEMKNEKEKEAKPVEAPKPTPIPQIRAPPPAPPPLERKPVYTGPQRYTYDEFKQIETQNNIKKQQKEKELKAQAKQAHILKTIENMRGGGIPTFNY